MRVVICRRDFELSGDPVADRQRYRRGHVVDCLPDGVGPGAGIEANPFMQVIDVADLTPAQAEQLCQSEYDAWRAGLEDGYFADPGDPRHALDDASLFARRHRRVDIDAPALRQSLRDAVAPGADHRVRPAATAAELMGVVILDERATRVSL